MQNTRSAFMEICEWWRGDGGDSCLLRFSIHIASRLGMICTLASKDRTWEIMLISDIDSDKTNVKFLKFCCNSTMENVLMQTERQH